MALFEAIIRKEADGTISFGDKRRKYQILSIMVIYIK